MERFLYLCFVIVLVFFTTSAFEFIVHTNPNASIVEKEKLSHCVVVLHDSVRGYLNWNQDWFVKAVNEQNIKLRELKEGSTSLIGNANVVIFHAPTHTNRVSQGLLRKRYGDKAIFALLSMEQPNYATLMKDLNYLQNSFDLMITYSLSSTYPETKLPNMPITYYPSHILRADEVLKPATLSFEEKNGYGTGVTVALFASNCKLAGANERLKYIQELMQYIEVHSYGGCLNNRKEPEMPSDPAWPAIAQRRARKIKVLSHYRFYLAFENAPIDDYVSEKVFEGIFAGSIPVYRGSKTIHKFMPANDSFINANEMNPKQLATLLQSIGKDPNKYAQYFAYKQRPLAKSFQEIVDMSYVHPNVLRRVCDYAHTTKRKNVVESDNRIIPADTKEEQEIVGLAEKVKTRAKNLAQRKHEANLENLEKKAKRAKGKGLGGSSTKKRSPGPKNQHS